MYSRATGSGGVNPVEEFCSLLRSFSQELEEVAASFASADIDQRFFLQMTDKELAAFDLSPDAITQLSVVREVLKGWTCPACTTKNQESCDACTMCHETNPSILEQLSKDGGNRKIKRGTGNSRYREGLYTFGTQMSGKKAELVLENIVKVEKPKAKLRKVRGRGSSKYQKIKKMEEEMKKDLPVKPSRSKHDQEGRISLKGLSAIREANNQRRKQRSAAVLKESLKSPPKPTLSLDDFWASVREKNAPRVPEEPPRSRINPLLRSSSETRGELYRAGPHSSSSRSQKFSLSNSKRGKLTHSKTDSILNSCWTRNRTPRLSGIGMRSSKMR